MARLAATYLRSKNVALVLGSRIHLYGVNRQQFLSDICWVKHELKHVGQFKNTVPEIFMDVLKPWVIWLQQPL